jgi:hypothetical protein
MGMAKLTYLQSVPACCIRICSTKLQQGLGLGATTHKNNKRKTSALRSTQKPDKTMRKKGASRVFRHALIAASQQHSLHEARHTTIRLSVLRHRKNNYE